MKKQGKLKSKYGKWEIIPKNKKKKTINEIIDLLLANRGIKTKKQREEFLDPIPPEKIGIPEIGINKESIKKAIERIKKAIKQKEKVVIFGDYDVDGVTSSAILWEYLYGVGLDIMPHIPERFSEGYGIKEDSILKLKEKYPKLSLIITVDNGIIAFDAVNKAKKLGIDVIIIDHHEPRTVLTSRRNLSASHSREANLRGKKRYVFPDAFAVIHTTKLCGAGISWFFIRELSRIIHKQSLRFHQNTKYIIQNSLELTALGTIADQMPLTGVNRSIVKYGLEKLNETKRVGLNALINISSLKKGDIGVYGVNYMIAPRLNAMGRMEKAIDSLRLLCTKNRDKAKELAELLNRTNTKRQKTVDEVVTKVKVNMSKKYTSKIIVLDGDMYHEGVIGLAASKLVEEFWRPTIVISKGKKISKGSGRSIPGFNIISAIRSVSELLLGGGGHEMAAGFSINTKDINEFRKQLLKYAEKNLNSNLLDKKLKVDVELSLPEISYELVKNLQQMDPFGIGNPTPVFLIRNCVIADVKKVGKTGNHIKFKLLNEKTPLEGIIFNSINNLSDFESGEKLDIVFNLDENTWNGYTNLQMKVKDVREGGEFLISKNIQI